MTGENLEVASPRGARAACDFKGIDWQTIEIPRIESQGLFGRVANLGADDPPPESKTAAPTGIGSGGEITGKLDGNSWFEIYAPADVAAPAQGSGLRVQGFGFRSSGSGLRVQGFGFRALGAGPGGLAQGLGFGALGSGPAVWRRA